MTYFINRIPGLYYHLLDHLSLYNQKCSDLVTYNLAIIKIIIDFHLSSLLINYY